jgi:RimJ/RimL family protein N-acetyltransferase
MTDVVVATVAETARLRLRTWGEGDADAFYAVMNHEPVMRYLGGVQSRDHWQMVVDRVVAYQVEFGYTFWIVERREDCELLGWCGLKRINYPGAPNPGDMELGWRFRESAWGQGIAKEAAIASLDLAFGRFAAPFVIAVTFAVNEASWGLMERLGMRYMPELDFVDPRYADLGPTKQWRLDAADWPAARAALT